MPLQRKLGSLAGEVLLILVSLIIIIPLLIMLLGSFKTSREALLFNVSLPAAWRLDNYQYVIQQGGIWRAMLNSVLIVTAATGLCLVSAALCSFIIARKNTKFSNGLYSLFTLGMIAPMLVVPTIWLMQFLRLSGTYFGVIFLYVAINLPWSVFIFTGFIKTIPVELDEAAIVDGCGPYRMFFQIIMPLLKPALATNLVITAMSIWNDFMIPLYFFNTSEKWTMPLTVYNFFGQYFRDWNYVFADLVLTALPVTLLYLYCQKYIISGMTAGAVKG